MTSDSQPQSKKALSTILTTTFIGGLLVVLPAYLALLAFNKIIKGLVGLVFVFLKPIASILGIAEQDLAIPVALIAFIVICLLAGLIAQSSYAVFFKKTLEPLFNKIPGYILVRRLIASTRKLEQGETYEPAFVALGDSTEALSPGFLIEKHDNETSTVFVPAVPTPTVGAVYIVPNHRIHSVDVPLMDMVKFISRWGEGSPALLAAIEQIKQP